MKQFMILHYGFKNPTSEEMDEWNNWFETIKDIQIDRGGFRGGLKITNSGSVELPFSENSITGYTIIEASELNKAKEIAAECPIINSTEVYEIHK